jgi:hypothetical protein
MGAVWDLPTKTTEEICAEAERRVDLRQAEDRRSITIGYVRIQGDGTVTEIHVEDEYLKPSARE